MVSFVAFKSCHQLYLCYTATFAVVPEISTVGRSEIINEGDSVTFNCTADGIPPPTINWFRNAIPVSMTNTQITTMEHEAFRDDIPGQNGVTSILTISPTNRVANEGRYICEASNSADSKILEFPYLLTINEGNNGLHIKSPDGYITSMSF